MPTIKKMVVKPLTPEQKKAREEAEAQTMRKIAARIEEFERGGKKRGSAKKK